VNHFDILTIGNAIVVVFALYQLRVCTLMLAANNMLVTLALGTIARYGPPASQRFLPVYVFSDENLSTAFAIMAISLASLAGFTIFSGRQRVRIGPDAPIVPRQVLVAIAVYLVVLAGSSATLLTSGYLSQPVLFELAGAHALICSLVVYELARRRLLFLITARKAFLIMFVIMAATGYAKGGTGLSSGYLVASALLMLPHTGAARRLRNVARITVALLAIVTIAFTVRSVRASLHEEGTGAIHAFAEKVAGVEDARETSGEGLEGVGANSSQYAAHMLECITLYNAGLSREWRSIYNVVEYTFEPSFLLRPFGWKRPIEAPWELAEHFVNGGGVYVLGEFYWNGGFLCVVIMTTALSFFCFIVDKKYRASPFWLMMVSQFAPAFLMGYGYGFAQIARGAINGLLIAAVYKVGVALSTRMPLSTLAAGGSGPELDAAAPEKARIQ
jgi:hypothetical protein